MSSSGNSTYVSLVYDNPGGKRKENANAKPCEDLLAQLVGQTGLKTLLMQRTQATDRRASSSSGK